MADETVDVRIRLRDSRKFITDAKAAGASVETLGGKTRAVGVNARKSSSGVGILRTSIGRLSATAALATGSIVGLALGFAGKTAIGEWREAMKTNRATGQVIKSTGGAANVSAKQVANLATSISEIAGIDDEAVQQAENLLLTFTGVRNEAGKGNKIFDRTTMAAADMSAAFKAAGKNMSVQDAALQLGKALNDPAEGYTRLKRVGVSFTKSQGEQIKKLSASGDKLGAQRIILRELNKEFGGQAKKTADPFDKLNVSMKNLAETIGFAIGPSLAVAAAWLSKFVTQMSTGTGQGGRFVDKIRGAALALRDFGVSIWPTIRGIAQFSVKVWNVLLALRTFSLRIETALYSVAQRFSRFAAGATAAVSRAGGSIRNFVQGAIGRFNAIKSTVSTFASKLGSSVQWVVRQISRIKTTVMIVLGAFNTFKTNVLGAIQPIIDKVGNLIDKLGSLKDAIPGAGLAGSLGIPGFALGGVVPGGPILVGERGPEILSPPRGSTVTPLTPASTASAATARTAAQAANGVPYVIVMDGRNIAKGVARHAATDRARA